MPIDPVKMLKDIPGAFHLQVKDAHGALHDGVMIGVSRMNGARDFGFPEFAEGDTVRVVHPFDVPATALEMIAGGVPVRRRITGSRDYRGLFVTITLSEVLK